MKATILAGSQLNVNLGLEDKETGLKAEKIQCVIRGQNNPYLKLHIVESIEDLIEKPRDINFFIQAGLHLTAIPPKVRPLQRTNYNLYMSPQVFYNLTNKLDQNGVGYIGSRTDFDRIDITYAEVSLKNVPKPIHGKPGKFHSSEDS